MNKLCVHFNSMGFHRCMRPFPLKKIFHNREIYQNEKQRFTALCYVNCERFMCVDISVSVHRAPALVNSNKITKSIELAKLYRWFPRCATHDKRKYSGDLEYHTNIQYESSMTNQSANSFQTNRTKKKYEIIASSGFLH